MIEWIELTTEEQLELIRSHSRQQSQVIFKHSTRCSTSSLAKTRLEREEAPDGVDFYYLDLIRYRHISNKIAEDFSVYHESPQVLLIRNGECIYDESHLGIHMDNLKEQIEKLA